MRTRSLGLLLSSLLVADSAAYASTMTVGAGGFSNPPAITFNSIINGEPITSQFAAQGVTFGNLWGDQTGDLTFFADPGAAVANNFGNSVLGVVFPATMNFSTPYEMVGFELFSNGFTTVNVVGVDGEAKAFNIYAHIPPIPRGDDHLGVPARGVFVGFENPTGIRSISIGPSAVNNAFLVDDIFLQAPVGVPEPGTLALMGVSLLGLVAGARRRFGR